MNATDQLRAEHHFIITLLDLVETLSNASFIENASVRKCLQSVIPFLDAYVELFHNGKEEIILIPAMEEIGFSSESGPLALMLLDHHEGEKLLSRMHESLSGVLDGAPSSSVSLLKAVKDFAWFMRNHIEREDSAIFLMAELSLSENRLSRMAREFREFETMCFTEEELVMMRRLIDACRDICLDPSLAECGDLDHLMLRLAWVVECGGVDEGEESMEWWFPVSVPCEMEMRH